MEVKIDPVINLETLLPYVKENHDVLFIIDGRFNIYLSMENQHIYLLSRLGLSTNDCFISSGSFKILHNNLISFRYHELGQVISVIPEVAQEKIKKFLRSKGVEFYG